MLTDRILAYLLIVKLMVFLTAKAGRKYIHYLAQIPHVLIEDCEAQERGMWHAEDCPVCAWDTCPLDAMG